MHASENKLRLMFSSLKFKNFRLLWIGAMISSTGDFIEIVALNWLVYEITNSPFYLGMFNLARSLPVLFFTLIAGALADKYDRRMLMIYSQGTAMVLSGTLAALAFYGKLTLFPMMAIGILQGIANSFNLPIRQSLIAELVPREKIVNAVALNGASLTMTLALGPALGGFIVGAFGPKYALLLNALSFVAVIGALYIMKVPGHIQKHTNPVFQSLREGISYILGNRLLLTVVSFSLIMISVGLSYITLLPVFSKDYFHLGPAGYGYLFSIAGVGAVMGSLFSGVRSREKVKKAMVISFIGYGLSMLLFGLFAVYLSSYILLFAVLLILIGFCISTFNVTNNSTLQLMVDENYRGRVLSTVFLGFGLTSLGSFVIGFIAQYTSAAVAYIIIGCLMLFLSIFLVKFTKDNEFHK